MIEINYTSHWSDKPIIVSIVIVGFTYAEQYLYSKITIGTGSYIAMMSCNSIFLFSFQSYHFNLFNFKLLLSINKQTTWGLGLASM